MTTVPKIPTPPRGWRITWPMILADLVVAAALIPVVLPQLVGAPGWLRTALMIFSLVVARLNHSPLPTPGGGLTSEVSNLPLLLLVCGAGLAMTLSSGCTGSGWQGQTRTCLDAVSLGLDEADVVASQLPECPDSDQSCVQKRVTLGGVLDVARAALVAGYAVVASAVGTEAAWQRMAACLASAVQAVLTALQDAGATIPQLLTDAVHFVEGFTGPCGAGRLTARLPPR